MKINLHGGAYEMIKVFLQNREKNLKVYFATRVWEIYVMDFSECLFGI